MNQKDDLHQRENRKIRRDQWRIRLRLHTIDDSDKGPMGRIEEIVSKTEQKKQRSGTTMAKQKVEEIRNVALVG
ncbi:MAG: hypothetical protein IID46_13005, partial [Planctomycetes bacterium]|nr:hypothetical protein [Planctomycetota bacterium]